MSYHVPWPKNELWQDDYRWPSGGHKEWHHRWARPVGRVWLRNDEGGNWWKQEPKYGHFPRGTAPVAQVAPAMLPGRIPVPPPAPLPVKSVPPPPVPCVVGRLPSSGRLLHDVWSWNFHYEWDALMSVLEGQPRPIMVALDTEFPGFLLEDTPFAPRSARYRALRENVEHLWPIQFGLAVAGSEGLPLGAWTFNLSFNLATNLYSEESVLFLQAAGVDFPRHAVEGIDPQQLAWKLSSSPLVGEHQDSPEWVTFSGWYDWGYLLKIVTGRPMPYDLGSFDQLLGGLCPVRRELRDLLPRGSLDALLGSHGLTRLGPAHTAGSDALATLELFLQVSAEKKDEELSHRVENLSSTTTVAPADEAQVSSRDTPDVENETSNSEANSHSSERLVPESNSEPIEPDPDVEMVEEISDGEVDESWEPTQRQQRLEIRSLRRLRHRHRNPRTRCEDARRPEEGSAERMLSDRILEFIDIDNEVWEPVLKVFHATGYTSLFFAIVLLTLVVFSALYLLL